MADNTRFQRAIAQIDAANAEDPNLEVVNAREVPKELVYGRRMSAWVERLRPDAPEPLRLAARAQHIRRWEIPRDKFPMDRAGYHRWRTTLYKFHADQTAAILRDVGYDEDTIARASDLLQKKRLKSDPDTQTIEDAAALVFLEHHAREFAARPDMNDEKLIDILKKTWKKMSPQGQEAALHIDLPPRLSHLIRTALRV
ncbi:MAG: DUF4202 domain-containing protein [Candidatus Hydrogenedentales bacterium]